MVSHGHLRRLEKIFAEIEELFICSRILFRPGANAAGCALPKNIHVLHRVDAGRKTNLFV